MSLTLEIALNAVRNMPERSGFYTAEELIRLELSHLQLLEAAINAIEYINPKLYAADSLNRAIARAQEVRETAGLL